MDSGGSGGICVREQGSNKLHQNVYELSSREQERTMCNTFCKILNSKPQTPHCILSAQETTVTFEESKFSSPHYGFEIFLTEPRKQVQCNVHIILHPEVL